MSSVKCPHCGLVNFASAVNCKRCGNFLHGSAESRRGYPPTAGARGSSARFHTDNPLAAWALTIVLLIANVYLAYPIALRATGGEDQVVPYMLGRVMAWPIVLLIVYAVSRKFREKYSMHAVINYGLGLNTIIHAIMTLPTLL